MCAMGRSIDLTRPRAITCRSGRTDGVSAWLTFASKVFVSFGGLLLYIDGPYQKLNPLRLDYVYLLMKK